MTHIQCLCPRLKESRIKVHHEIWRGICSGIESATLDWQGFQEQEAGKPLPDSAPDDIELEEWNKMTAALSRSQMGAKGAKMVDISRQRPDGFFIKWGHRTAVVCEFSRRMVHTPASCSEIDDEKLVHYRELLIQMRRHLPNWDILWAPFSVGVRGTILKTTWHRNFDILGIPTDKREGIMAGAVQHS